MMGSIFAPDAVRGTVGAYQPQAVETIAPHRAPEHVPIETITSQRNEIHRLDHVNPLEGVRGFIARSDAGSEEALMHDGGRAREQPLVSPELVSEFARRRPAGETKRPEDVENRQGFVAQETRTQNSAETVVPRVSAPYEPLVPANQARAAHVQPMVANAARTAKAEAVRRVSPGQREADEIHIHIGRIEVATSAPPAPQAARPVPTPRKALSLDEYLRRGNGSGR